MSLDVHNKRCIECGKALEHILQFQHAAYDILSSLIPDTDGRVVEMAYAMNQLERIVYAQSQQAEKKA